MNRHLPISLLCALLLASASSIRAQSPEGECLVNGAGFVFEQDVMLEAFGLGNLNSDRNYTQGLGIFLTSSRLTNRLDRFLGLRARDHYTDTLDTAYIPRYIYRLPAAISPISLAGFTPDELRDSLPIIGDRPYSSVAMLSVQDVRVDQENYRSRSWKVSIGVLGVPNVAKNAQTWIHVQSNENNTKRPYNPMGWHNQISHGGEPTAMVSYSTKRLMNKQPLEREARTGSVAKAGGVRGQLVQTLNVDIGYLTQASYGIEARGGKIDLRTWYRAQAWKISSIAQTSRPLKDERDSIINANKVDYFLSEPIFEAYLFAGMRSGIMVYNGSLHGQFRNTAYRLPYWDTGFFTNVGRLGFTLAGRHVSLTVYGAWKSSEIMTSYARIHSWGGGNLSFNW